MNTVKLLELATQIGQRLLAQKNTVTCAESCTGGGLSYIITSISQSSNWFERGFVTYSNQAKVDMLGVDENLINAKGAVSKEVAAAMVTGAVTKAGAHCGVAITGVAGPTGGTLNNPVGTVWIAWSIRGVVETTCFHFKGYRLEVREQAIEAALVGLLDKL